MRMIAAAAACALLAGLALAPQALAAGTDLTNPGSQVENLTVDGLTEILRELGAAQIEVIEAEGTKIIHFQSGTIPFSLGISLCDARPGSCLGLIMLVGLDPGATHYPLELFNTFNKDHPFASAIQLDGNKFAVARMVLTDGGVTKKNVASNIATFSGAPEAIMKFLASQLVAGYRQGQARFQPAALARTTLQPVRLSPHEVAQIVKATSNFNGGRLR